MARRQPVYGVTKCPRCHELLSDGRTLFVRTVEEYPWRTSSSGHMYRSLTPVKVEQRWHDECWTAALREMAECRLRADLDQAEEMLEIAESAGVFPPEKLAKLRAAVGDAHQALTEARVTA